MKPLPDLPLFARGGTARAGRSPSPLSPEHQCAGDAFPDLPESLDRRFWTRRDSYGRLMPPWAEAEAPPPTKARTAARERRIAWDKPWLRLPPGDPDRKIAEQLFRHQERAKEERKRKRLAELRART
jgi:hypothetical protein